MNQDIPDDIQEQASEAETPDALDVEGAATPSGEGDSPADESAPDSAEQSPQPEEPEVASAPARVTTPSSAVFEDAKVSDEPAKGEFEWYVLRVQSGREDTVSNNLRKKLVLAQMDHLVRDIAVPKQKITEIKEGKKKIRSQKLFPGYVFLEMTLEDELWYLIRDTSGIGDFVGSHQAPIPMPSSEVHKIRQMMEEEEEPQEVQIDLVKNDGVKIKEGPFENFDGVVEEVHPAKGMVRVMVSIFGRSTPVDLEYWQVEKL